MPDNGGPPKVSGDHPGLESPRDPSQSCWPRVAGGIAASRRRGRAGLTWTASKSPIRAYLRRTPA
jgi:hypothetical protein